MHQAYCELGLCLNNSLIIDRGTGISSFSPTLASLKILSFKQPDANLDSEATTRSVL